MNSYSFTEFAKKENETLMLNYADSLKVISISMVKTTVRFGKQNGQYFLSLLTYLDWQTALARKKNSSN